MYKFKTRKRTANLRNTPIDMEAMETTEKNFIALFVSRLNNQYSSKYFTRASVYHVYIIEGYRNSTSSLYYLIWRLDSKIKGHSQRNAVPLCDISIISLWQAHLLPFSFHSVYIVQLPQISSSTFLKILEVPAVYKLLVTSPFVKHQFLLIAG